MSRRPFRCKIYRESRRAQKIIALLVVQWWEDEPQRAYVLHKASALQEGMVVRQQAPAAPVPAYLSSRVQGVEDMPSVEVVLGTRTAREEGEQTVGTGEGSAGREEHCMAAHYRHVKVEEEEMCAVVGYVVRDMDGHLYIELLQGLRRA